MSSDAPGLASELADLAIEVAREAAALVRERRLGTVTVADTKTSAIDVVTEADRATEALVRDRILARRPDDAILGEEGDDVVGTSGVRWIVDPIDGTVNFLYGIPQYAVSLAAEVDGVVVAGVVVDVAKDVFYVARPGADAATVALRDDVPIRVGEPRPLDRRLVATGFSYVTEVKVVQAAAVGVLLPRIRDIRRLGSCALDLCHVAEGRLDAYVEEGVNLWDHAAGGLIARAAGARTETGPGAGGLTLLLCAPAHGFDDMRQATLEAGFWAE
ncbi:inositol monophosphatase family protein [Nocardioides sp.]|uniref:inositol monophosphatase family protein n=1 Tax=Nocardioides sp. TaxID=35761 RepID=UPI002728360D|nr:inositol monophosphatase family protein [Nocardioides sp.]MDO9458146.1 inositol monophosphatase family protein [Nocardioides sp.]